MIWLYKPSKYGPTRWHNVFFAAGLLGGMTGCGISKVQHFTAAENIECNVYRRGKHLEKIEIKSPDTIRGVRILFSENKQARTVTFFDASEKVVQKTSISDNREEASGSRSVYFSTTSTEANNEKLESREWRWQPEGYLLYKETEVYDHSGRMVRKEEFGPAGVRLTD